AADLVRFGLQPVDFDAVFEQMAVFAEQGHGLFQFLRLLQDDSGQHLGGRRRLRDLVGVQAVRGAVNEIEDVIQRGGQQVNVLAVEGRNKGLVQFDQNPVRHLIAAELDLLDFLHSRWHLLVIVRMQQVAQSLRAVDDIGRDLQEHVEELGITRYQAHRDAPEANADVGRSMRDEELRIVTALLKQNYRMGRVGGSNEREKNRQGISLSQAQIGKESPQSRDRYLIMLGLPVSGPLAGTILNLLLDCFLFQLLDLSCQLFGLIAKPVQALSQGGDVRLASRHGGRGSRSNRRRCWCCRQVGQGLIEGVPVDQSVAHRQHHLLELGHTSFGCLNVNGLEVKESASDGKGDNVSAQHARALLVPQREVLGDVLVLVDARFNLHGAVHQLLFGESIKDQFP